MQVIEDDEHERTSLLYKRQQDCKIEGTASQMDLGTGSAKTTLIAECVDKYIQDLLSQVGKDYPEFKASELLHVGSYKEGTKIRLPNEFDFLAVIDSLSEPGIFRAEKIAPRTNQSYRPTSGLVKLRVAPEYMQTWGKYHHEGYLRCFQKSFENTFIHNHETFCTIVLETIAKMANREGQKTLRVDQDLTVITDSVEYHRSIFETKKVRVKSVEIRHPNIFLIFLVENRNITADLCPAIRYRKLEDCFDEKLCLSQDIADLVKEHGSVLFVGMLDCDFRVTFTEIEVNYMQCKLHRNHKLIYIYLKYVMHVIAEKKLLTGFTSYMLKNVVMHHDLHCNAKDKTTMQCFGEILDLLDGFVEKTYLPVIFNTDINLMFETANYERVFRKMQLVALRDLLELSKEKDTTDAHIADIRNIADALVKEFDRNPLRPDHAIPKTLREIHQD